MDFTVLYQRPDKPELPRCEAQRKTNYANDSDNTDRQCKWSAVVSIDGKPLCSKHAGAELLRIYMEKNQ